MTIPAVTGGATITSTWGNAVADDLNGRVLNISKRTTNSSYTTTYTDVNAAVTVDVRAGYSYRIYAEANVDNDTIGDSPALTICDGSDTIQIIRYSYQSNTSRQQQICCTEIYDAASDGTLTRKTRVGRAAGSGQSRAVCTSTAPGLMVIEEIGPTP